MIIHGTEDKMVPIEHGAALHAAIKEEYRAEPFWAMGKGHNDLDYNFDPYIESVKEYLSEYLGEYRSDRGERRAKKKRRSHAIDNRLSISSSNQR